MTYYNRIAQLRNTLESFTKSKYKDFKVIIIDDCSAENITDIGSYGFGVEILRMTEKISHNTAPLYNIGFKHALDNNADIVIMQNAECYHYGDVITHASKIREGEYYSYHCYSLAEGQSVGAKRNDLLPLQSGDEGWYNHATIRPCMFHFTSAIRAVDLRKLNGFDERFSGGICYEDDYFVHQVKNLKLDRQFVHKPIVYHQWHSIEPRRSDLIQRNEKLWRTLSANKEYRAVHTITANL